MQRIFVDRSLPLAIVFGLLVGCLAYQLLLSEWYPALAMAAVYAGAAYFYREHRRRPTALAVG
jgi:predicted branched-subunit amino acid permease